MEYFSKQGWVKFIVSEKWNDDKIYINFNPNKKQRDIKKKKRKDDSGCLPLSNLLFLLSNYRDI